MKLKTLVLPALLSLFLATAGRAQIINTEAGWDGTTGVSSFGNSAGFQFYNTPIFGQTFKAPVGADFLKSFEINVSPRSDFNTPTSNGVFKASVAVFDTVTRTIGAVIWTSGDTVLSSAYGYTAYNFAVNANVSASQSYVFFAEELSGRGSYKWGGSQSDLYTDGTFVYSNTPGGGGTFPAFTSTVADTAFVAVFTGATPLTPVPEASTYALFGAAACMSIAGLRRVRKAK
ncbi:MAG: hypothetical protein ABI222_09515, partial [Opitutaceae bacterium]